LRYLLLACEGCKDKFVQTNQSLKRPREEIHEDRTPIDNNDDDGDEDEDEEDDGDNYRDAFEYDNEEIRMPQSKQTERKPVEAVEKPMSDDQLISYFNRYILILQQQRQQISTLSDKQLHEVILELFNTMEYKNDTPDGK
jgi:hypothetical protein